MIQLEKLKDTRILVAGEVGIDEYIWGDTRRISPEAPVPVIEVESQSSRLGLAGNVAQNIATLGAHAELLTVRGRDDDGARLESMANEVGVAKATYIDDETRPTLRKTRIIAQKQHVVRVDYESSHPLSPALANVFLQSLEARLDDVQGVILQDYGKGIWSSDTVGFVARAREKNVPVFVDPSRLSPLGLYRGVTLLTPNLMEAEFLTGRGSVSRRGREEDDEYLEGVAKEILNQTEAEHAIITCGASGMVSLSRDGGLYQRIPTFAREVFDVTGAGDTVIAMMALMMVTGHSLAESMHVANAAAGLVVGRIGASSITTEELQNELLRLKELKA